MRYMWVALAALLAVVPTASAETVVSSNVLADTDWTAGGSPYVVTREVRVRFNSTLTMGEGVEVRFESGAGLATDDGSSIVVAGSRSLPVLLTSASPAPAEGDWEGLEVYSSPGSSFTRAVFEYAATCLELNVSDSAVDHCVFRDSQTGLRCLRSSPEVIGCSFTGHSAAGIHCWSRESVPTIDDSNFSDNLWNVYLSSYAPPVVTINAEGNWWGTSEEAAIMAGIYDREDTAALYGLVDYDPWLGGEPVERSTWGGIKGLFRE